MTAPRKSDLLHALLADMREVVEMYPADDDEANTLYGTLETMRAQLVPLMEREQMQGEIHEMLTGIFATADEPSMVSQMREVG